MRKPTEVVVVGGGIIGCSVALELARRGVQVTLFERDQLAGAASGRNHGLIGYPQNKLLDELYRASHALYRELASSSDISIGLDTSPRGLLIVVRVDADWGPAQSEAHASAEGGIEITKLDASEVAREEPGTSEVLGGYLINDYYRLDPAALTLAIAYQASAEGAVLRTNTEVKQVLVKDGGVTGVATDEGIVEADVVVDAAGPWAPRLARSAGVDLPIRGARGWLILTAAVPQSIAHLIQSAGWHLTSGQTGPGETTLAEYGKGGADHIRQVGMLIQQNSSGHVLIGGARITSMRDEPESVEVTHQIAATAVDALPALASASITGVWSGVRPMSVDGLPLIGWIDGVEGLFAAGGHGGQGVILGGGTGVLAAQMITGEKTIVEPARFDPNRE